MVLKDCSKCMVYTPQGQRLSEARVVHTKDSVTLYFEHYKLHDARFKSRVDFFDDQTGLVVTYCEIIIRRNSKYPEMPEPWMADCNIIDVKEVVQRQRDVRAKVYLEMEFKSEKRGTFYGTIKNLSAGGMYITTVQPLERNELISFNYCFRTLERRFEAVTLWAKRVEGGRFGYGCRFVRLTTGGESAIREFVYKRLLEKERDRK